MPILFKPYVIWIILIQYQSVARITRDSAETCDFHARFLLGLPRIVMSFLDFGANGIKIGNCIFSTLSENPYFFSQDPIKDEYYMQHKGNKENYLIGKKF